MERVLAGDCLSRWDLPLSEFWVCDPALKGGCCFLQKHWVFAPGSSNQVLQVGRSAEGRKSLPRGDFPSGQEGFMMKEIWEAGWRSRRLPSQQGMSETALQLEKTPTSATFAETNTRSLCRDLCVWRCFSPCRFNHQKGRKLREA